jgi:hypothetical protein
MVVRRYFYVDIDPIVRQVATLKMMELIARFFHNSLQPSHGVQFHFFALWHTTNSKEAYGIIWPCGPHHFRLGVSRIFNDWIWKRLEWHKIWSLHEHGTIDHLGSTHFSYVWLCNWKHPFLVLLEGKSPGTLHVGQALPWKAALIWCGIM